jgi:hypothetical protein
MSGCSKQAWLNKGKMPRNPAHKRVLKKVSTQSRISWIWGRRVLHMDLELKGASARSLKMHQNIVKILTFRNFPFLNVIKSKLDFFKNEYLCMIKGS